MEATVGKNAGNGTDLVDAAGPGLNETEKKVLDFLTRNQTDRHITVARLDRETGSGSAVTSAVSQLLHKKLIKVTVSEDGPATVHLNKDAPQRHARADKRVRDPKSEAINAKIRTWMGHEFSTKEIAKKVRLTEAAVINRIFNMRLRGELPKAAGKGPRQPVKPKNPEPSESKASLLDQVPNAEIGLHPIVMLRSHKSRKLVPVEINPSNLARLVEDKREEEEVEPGTLESGQPDVAEILERVRSGANEIRKLGWHVEVLIKLTYPPIPVLGAS